MKKAEKLNMEAVLKTDALTCKKDGSIMAKWSYYYRHGHTPEKYAEMVTRSFPNAQIIDKGDHMHGFVGSAKAGSARDSYMWVQFLLSDDPKCQDCKVKNRNCEMCYDMGDIAPC